MKSINVNEAIKIIAGVFIVSSLLLGHYVNENWYLFTAFVGLNLFQSGFSKWCLLEKILVKLGVKQSDDSCGC